MYRIYLDGELFYDPRLPEYALTGIKCDLEVNKTGTLKFTIPATHPLIGSVQKMYSELTLYQDKDWLYSGRVLSDDTDFDGNRTIECEGELSYLLDSIQRYHEYHDISVKDYFTDLIAKHNADVREKVNVEKLIKNVKIHQQKITETGSSFLAAGYGKIHCLSIVLGIFPYR